jgi:hypothetical protein
LKVLLTGATGLTSGALDTRLANVSNLPNIPYLLTPSISYDAYTARPVHRFYQMWQQKWRTADSRWNHPLGRGSVEMGVYNVAQGDMPYFKQIR